MIHETNTRAATNIAGLGRMVSLRAFHRHLILL